MSPKRERIIAREHGRSRFINREQAEELRAAGCGQYGGEENGVPILVITTVFVWRKVTQRTFGGQPLGYAGMALVRQ